MMYNLYMLSDFPLVGLGQKGHSRRTTWELVMRKSPVAGCVGFLPWVDPQFEHTPLAARTVRIVRRLDSATLETLVRQHVIVPTQSENGEVFSQADIARMELLCDLTEGFELDEDLLALLMSLIDQLHAARSDLQRLSRAVDVEAAEVRQRILARMTSGD